MTKSRNNHQAPRGEESAPVRPVRVSKRRPEQQKSAAEPIPAAPSDTPSRWPSFIGPGKSVVAFGHELRDPLIYVVDRDKFRAADASLLCLRRQISEPPRSYSPNLGYWPQLASFTPQQLWCYVQWLASGRSDPNVELGLVFVYFYGLERRALVDGEDVPAIAAEVLRLIRIYGTHRSFMGYATGLLAHLAMCGRLKLTKQLTTTLLDFQNSHVADAVETMLIGSLARDEQPLPAPWAEKLAAQHELAKRGVVRDRAPEELSLLFATRYREEFGEGLVPKRSAQDVKVAYRPASPTIAFQHDNRLLVPPAVWPRVSYWNKQLGPVVSIYNSCVEELRGYARRLKPEGVLTHEAFAALPVELRDEVVHPKQSAWETLLAEFSPESGATLVPVERIATLLDLTRRPKLTLAQSKKLAEFAETLGTPLEPDARITGSGYAWEHHVAAIKLPAPVLPQDANYTLASLVLRLAMDVATVDGTLDHAERRAIEAFLGERLELSPNDHIRLRALIDVLDRDRPGTRGINKLIKTVLKPEHTRLIAQFLVEVASATEGIDDAELKALRKVFKALNVPDEVEEKLLERRKFLATPASASEVPEVDLERVRAIRLESDKAAKILLEAIEGVRESGGFELDEDADDDPGTAVAEFRNAADRRFVGLRATLQPLVAELLTRPIWTPHDLEACARRHGSSSAAAVDEINAWSDEALGDFLIEEAEGFTINTGLLNEAGR